MDKRITREIKENQRRLSKWGWKGDITDSIIDISDLDYDELRNKGKASDDDWYIRVPSFWRNRH